VKSAFTPTRAPIRWVMVHKPKRAASCSRPLLKGSSSLRPRPSSVAVNSLPPRKANQQFSSSLAGRMRSRGTRCSSSSSSFRSRKLVPTSYHKHRARYFKTCRSPQSGHKTSEITVSRASGSSSPRGNLPLCSRLITASAGVRCLSLTTGGQKRSRVTLLYCK
jgi:hypothetical protein